MHTTGSPAVSQVTANLQGSPASDKGHSSFTKLTESPQRQKSPEKSFSKLQSAHKDSSMPVTTQQQEKLLNTPGTGLKESEKEGLAPETFALAKLVAALKGDHPEGTSKGEGNLPDAPVAKLQQNIPKWRPAMDFEPALSKQSAHSVRHEPAFTTQSPQSVRHESAFSTQSPHYVPQIVATSDIGSSKNVHDQSEGTLSSVNASSSIKVVPNVESADKNVDEKTINSRPPGKTVADQEKEEKHKTGSHSLLIEKETPEGDKQNSKNATDGSVKKTTEKTQANLPSEIREKRSDESPDVSERPSGSGRSRLERSEESSHTSRDSDERATGPEASSTEKWTARSRSPLQRSRSPLQRSSSGESREARHQRRIPSPKRQDQDRRRTEPTGHRSRSPSSHSDSSRSSDRRFSERSRSIERRPSDSRSSERRTEKHREWHASTEQPQSGRESRPRLSGQQWLGLGKIPDLRSQQSREQRTELRVRSEDKLEKGDDSDDGDFQSRSLASREGEETRRTIQITNRSGSDERRLGARDSDDRREFSSPAQRRHLERRDSSPSPSRDISGFASFLHGTKPASSTPKRIVEIKSQSQEVKLQDRDYRLEGLSSPRSPSFHGRDEQSREKSPENRDLGLRVGKPTPGKGLLPIPSGPHERSTRADRGRPSHFEDQDYRRGPSRPSEGTRGRSPVDHRPRRPQPDVEHLQRGPSRVHPYDDVRRGRPGPRSSDPGGHRRSPEEFHRGQGPRGHRGELSPGRDHFGGGRGRHGDYDGRREGHGYQGGRPQDQWRDSQDRFRRQGPPRGRGGPPVRGHPQPSRPYRGRPAMDRR